MVEEVAEHEASRLILHGRVAHTLLIAFALIAFDWLVRLLEQLIFLVLLVADAVLSGLLVEFTLHQYIEKVANGCMVCHLAADINCPEERMGAPVFHVREADKVDRHVADHSLLIQGVSNRV